MTLEEFALTESYNSVKNILMMLVGKLSAKYRWDREEILAEANYQFVEACKKYDSEKGEFEPYIYTRVMQRILDTLRKERLQKNRFCCLEGVWEELNYLHSFFSWEDLQEALSEDARFLLRLATDLPGEIQELIQKRGENTPWRLRGAIREFLVGRLGWARGRVSKAMDELREALS